MINFDKFQLSNGLKVIVHNDKTTPIVAVNLLYNVGARDEHPDRLSNNNIVAKIFIYILMQV